MFNNMYGTPMLSAADVAAVTNGNGGMFGNNGDWWAIIILFALFGGWGGGFGGYGGGAGAMQNYVLGSDFATIQRQLSDGFNSIDNALDAQNSGICNLGYTQLELANGTNMNMMQGFNALGTQLADCCCKTQSGIERINTNNAMNTATITGAIKDCCCDNEKIAMQSRFDAQQYNCTTLQAIDKLGDRIIDYMSQDKMQSLRDENQSLKLRASQLDQSNYLINTLRPQPIPSFNVPNPYCNCNCNSGNGTFAAYASVPSYYFGGTTIA